MLNLLGLAFRARKVITGEEFVVDGIRSGKIKLVFLASDCGINTTKKVMDKAKSFNVEVINTYTCYELSQAIGKENRKVVGITDANFASALKKKNKR